MTLMRAILLVAAVSLPAVSSRAELYLVDVGGTDSSTGHTLRVSGIIDVDVATDVIASSSLSFHHEADPAISLGTVDVIGAGVDFVDMAGMLFVAHRAVSYDIAGSLYWYSASQSPVAWLRISDDSYVSSTPDFALFWGAGPVVSEIASISGFGQPLKIGTAVPEPSAFMYLSLVGMGAAGAARWRKRRMLNSAVRS